MFTPRVVSSCGDTSPPQYPTPTFCGDNLHILPPTSRLCVGMPHMGIPTSIPFMLSSLVVIVGIHLLVVFSLLLIPGCHDVTHYYHMHMFYLNKVCFTVKHNHNNQIGGRYSFYFMTDLLLLFIYKLIGSGIESRVQVKNVYGISAYISGSSGCTPSFCYTARLLWHRHYNRRDKGLGHFWRQGPICKTQNKIKKNLDFYVGIPIFWKTPPPPPPGMTFYLPSPTTYNIGVTPT